MCKIIELEIIKEFTLKETYECNKIVKKQGYKDLRDFLKKMYELNPECKKELSMK